jgi:imidazole glycerol-phosphate synthase subunit HisF
MFRPRIIPSLLLKGQGLVKTIRFEKAKAKYIGDPINAVRIFNDLEADELAFLDIIAGNEGRCISVDLVKDIGDEAFMPFAVGGGIRNTDQIRNLLTAGAEKVIINTAAIDNPSLIEEASVLFGNQSIVVSVDVKKNIWGKYKVFSRCGMKDTGLDPVEHIQRMESAGAGEILVNSIDMDGKMEGYDLTLMRQICGKVGIPVIALGGAGTTGDFVKVIKEAGASACAAGSMFVFHGPRKAVLVNYPDRQELEKLFTQ